MSKFFKLCQGCGEFFFDENRYRTHTCFQREESERQKRVNLYRKNAPEASPDRHPDTRAQNDGQPAENGKFNRREKMLKMKRELAQHGISMPVTSTYDEVLAAYRQEISGNEQ